jgi:prepilin-type N-terminal cleavage/methylation domain-containing protein
MKNRYSSGFTLIELLIVIAIIAILAAVAFVALDPLTRFQDARDSSRWSDVSAILSAIKVDQVDNGGSYVSGVNTDTSGGATVAGTEYMITSTATTTGCNVAECAVVAATDQCVDLEDLSTEGYLGSVPVSPNGSGSWSSDHTGYYMIKNSNGSVTIGACEAENISSITVTR